MKQFLEFYRNPWIWGTHLMGALVAWFAPLDVLDQSAALRSFTDLMGEIFPPVVGYKKSSKFPQVTALYFSLMFLLGPIWLWKGLTKLQYALIREDAPMWKRPRFVRASFVIVVWGLVWPGLALFGLFFNPGYDFHVVPINSSRFALGMWGVFFTLYPWLFPAVYVASVKRALRAD
jgi:hypothetical protein